MKRVVYILRQGMTKMHQDTCDEYIIVVCGKFVKGFCFSVKIPLRIACPGMLTMKDTTVRAPKIDHIFFSIVLRLSLIHI